MRRRILILGASGAIGAALAEELDTTSKVVRLARTGTTPSFDLTDEVSLSAASSAMREHGPFDWIIDATGALTIDGKGPEKSMSAITALGLARSFELNAIGPALALKHFAPLLGSGKVIYGKLSARVGSISDNNKGGWYGYRASKAAMNMMLQTAALELQRRNPECRVVALQPGTVRSKLSAPFASSVEHLLEPAESARGLIAALLAIEAREERRAGAEFVDYKGELIAW